MRREKGNVEEKDSTLPIWWWKGNATLLVDAERRKFTQQLGIDLHRHI